MQTLDSELELFEFNDDLIGFFNSRDMIMNSLQDLIQLITLRPSVHARAEGQVSVLYRKNHGKHNFVLDFRGLGFKAFLRQNALKLEKWPRRSCKGECSEARQTRTVCVLHGRFVDGCL